MQEGTWLVAVHLTGHGTVRAFAVTSRGLALVEACRADDVRSLVRVARIGSAMRPYQIVFTAIARHPAWADRLRERFAKEFSPVQRVNFLYHRANRHIRDGELATAREMLVEAMASSRAMPGQPGACKNLTRASSARARQRQLCETLTAEVRPGDMGPRCHHLNLRYPSDNSGHSEFCSPVKISTAIDAVEMAR